jgi:hypothetical protein
MKKLLPLILVILFSYQCEKELNPEFGEFTDIRDSYTYKTVKIGSQTWFAENLRYLPAVYQMRVNGKN